MSQKLVRAIIIGIILAILQITLAFSPLGKELEYRLLDGWFALRGAEAPPEDIVIIALDEESYRNLGVPMTAAWPRALHAKLLERLLKFGVKKVVFDVLFIGPTQENADRELATAFRKIPSVIGAELGTVNDNGSGFRQQSALLPYEDFRQNAEVGLVGFPLTNGVARYFPVNESELTKDLKPLGVLGSRLRGGTLREPTEPALINFYGPPRTIKTFSYYQIMEDEFPFPKTELAGKTAFVGLSLRTGTGADKKDAYLTPFQSYGLTYGVELHATIAANIRGESWIKELPRNKLYHIYAALTLLVGTALLLMPPLAGLVVLLLASGLTLLSSYYLFLDNTFFPCASVSLIILPAAFLLDTLQYYLRARRERLKLIRAFEFYISPEMARSVARNKEALQLGGELVTATALFTDIAGFTHISESMAPARTASMLNAYFTEVMDAIFQSQGTLIKFIGDAVFALWGAPIRIEDHAQKTFEAAMTIMREVTKFNSSGRFPELHTRIGINTGPMLVGNLGAAKRFDFTAIGDSVNLASRVEGMNKYLGTTLLMTGATYKSLKKKHDLIEFGSFKVSGKDEAIELFGMFSTQPTATELNLFSSAVASYWDKNLAEAHQRFTSLIHGRGLFVTASKLYLSAIIASEGMEDTGPWDGSVKLDSK